MRVRCVAWVCSTARDSVLGRVAHAMAVPMSIHSPVSSVWISSLCMVDPVLMDVQASRATGATGVRDMVYCLYRL